MDEHESMSVEWAKEALDRLDAVVYHGTLGYDIYLPHGPLAGFHHAKDELALAQLVRDWSNP
jgi:hypothetical protein